MVRDAKKKTWVPRYTTAEVILKTGKVVNLVNQGFNTDKNFLICSDKANFNVSKYEIVKGRIFKRFEKSQLVNPSEVYIFNQTVFLIKDEHTLYTYDFQDDFKTNTTDQNSS